MRFDLPYPTLYDAHARPLAIIVAAGAGALLWTKTGGGRMSSRVTNISDLVQRFTGSCLLHSPVSARHCGSLAEPESGGEDFDKHCDSQGKVEGELQQDEEEEEDEEEKRRREAECWERRQREMRSESLVLEMETLMSEVFDAVSGVKRAYVALQDAQNPWDPERMRAADVSVVGQLRRLGVLRERYRKSVTCRGGGGGGGFGGVGLGVREVVAPYEAVAEELRREVKAREAEVENLKERLRCLMGGGDSSGKKGRSLSNKKLGFGAVAMSPSPELFEMTNAQVRETAKSFTSLIISLMRSAHWDIAAAVRSIESADCTESFNNSSTVGVHHAKYSLESYVCRKFFKGFDHETFYMDGSLSSLLNPEQHRRDCFTQFRDMKAMDPVELLGVLPSCQFGKFCSKKYLSIVHPRMEESFFGNSDHHRQVSGGNHPRTQFYKEFLGLAKSVWLLHLLAFSLDPAPSLFEASRGAEFHPEYMESVVRFFGGQVPAGHIVGFPISPGFRLGSSNTKSVIKARVYLASRS